MMTWASDRSGIASSGARDSDSHPHTPRPATSRTVISGLRALPAITRPMTPGLSAVAMAVLPERTGRAHTALRRNQEVARADHGVALLQPAGDLDDVATARADRDLLGPERAVAQVDEHEPARPGVHHCRDRDDQDRKSTRLNSSHIPLSRMPSS